MSKIIYLPLIFIAMQACNTKSPIKISMIEGNNFASCNIDNIRDTCNLKLSEISESCEIVLLEDDTTLKIEDFQLGQITVSENFIVAMPKQRPALLYSRDGKFIKRLDGNEKKNIYGRLILRLTDRKIKSIFKYLALNNYMFLG